MKTTNFKIGMAVVAASFFLASCNAGNQASNVANNSGDHQMAADSGRSAPARTKSEALNALYPHYLALQEALVDGQLTKAKEEALLVEEAGKSIEGAENLQRAAAQVLSSESLESQRNAFSPLSEALISLVKSNGVAVGEFYVAHCPMAFNDKGARWLSASKDIKNPYFGDKMLTCGSLEETLSKH
ncbi:DUF3347 domain-containing protein [Olivibacter sp. XZL3]|uniref:DUF3347 domain-containing protein n=1 Tax=Olivibacter sp. XZL3 TaxID=1735116 RepID=UPI001065700D|nr:DUF3347 domain-containing protein [Olivibacter sp. XZL3]